MTPRERIFTALQHQEADRVPRFEIWIDAILEELGQNDPAGAYVNLGQDCIMMPTLNPPHSNAWRNGTDEWGRVWKDGMFVDGVVDTADVLIATRIVTGIDSATQVQQQHMDVAPLVNGVPMSDGLLNAADLLLIQRKALGLVNF